MYMKYLHINTHIRHILFVGLLCPVAGVKPADCRFASRQCASLVTIKGWTFGCWLRHQRFGVLGLGVHGFTPIALARRKPFTSIRLGIEAGFRERLAAIELCPPLAREKRIRGRQ
jgi:hypothetical protein